MTDRIVTLRDNSNNTVYPVGFAPAGAVTTSMYTDASITTPKLADGSVTTSKLANNSVTTDKISPGAIVDGIQASSITSEKLADGSVTSAKLASEAVTTAKIADSAVTDTKIDWSTITTTSDTSSVVLPNSSDIKGWRITLACYCGASNNGGEVKLNPSTNMAYTRHSWTWTSSIVSDLKEGWTNQGANTGPSLLRGGSTGGAGYNTADITLMKQGSDNIGFAIHTAYMVYDYSALYNSRVLGSWKVSDNNATGLTLTFTKGTVSDFTWTVVPIIA